MNQEINNSGKWLNKTNFKTLSPRRLFGFVKDAGA